MAVTEAQVRAAFQVVSQATSVAEANELLGSELAPLFNQGASGEGFSEFESPVGDPLQISLSFPKVTFETGLSGVSAGTYGSSFEIPVLTIDKYGRVTNVDLAPAGSGGASGPASGDLSGSYPSPTVSGLSGHALPALGATSGCLRWNGSSWILDATAYAPAVHSHDYLPINNPAFTGSMYGSGSFIWRAPASDHYFSMYGISTEFGIRDLNTNGSVRNYPLVIYKGATGEIQIGYSGGLRPIRLGGVVKNDALAGVGIRPLVALADGTIDDQDSATFRATIGAAASSHDHDGTYLRLDGAYGMTGTMYSLSILPSTTNFYDLGAASQRYANIYSANIFVSTLYSGPMLPKDDLSFSFDIGSSSVRWNRIWSRDITTNAFSTTDTSIDVVGAFKLNLGGYLSSSPQVNWPRNLSTSIVAGDMMWDGTRLKVGDGTSQKTIAYTTDSVTGQLLTGYVVGSNTPISASDSILSAFQKVQGEINARALSSDLGNYLPVNNPAFTGTLVGPKIVAGSASPTGSGNITIQGNDDAANGYGDLNWYTGVGGTGIRRMTARWEETTDALSFFSSNDDGSSRSNRLRIYRNNSTPVRAYAGFDVGTGDLLVGNSIVISSTRKGTLQGLDVPTGDVSISKFGLLTELVGSTTAGALYPTGVTPSASNYAMVFSDSGAEIKLNASTNVRLSIANTNKLSIGVSTLDAPGLRATVWDSLTLNAGASTMSNVIFCDSTKYWTSFYASATEAGFRDYTDAGAADSYPIYWTLKTGGLIRLTRVTNMLLGFQINGTTCVDSSMNASFATVKSANGAGTGIRPAVWGADGTLDDQDAATFRTTISAAASSHSHLIGDISSTFQAGSLLLSPASGQPISAYVPPYGSPGGLLRWNYTSWDLDSNSYALSSHTHSYLPIDNPSFSGVLTGPLITSSGTITALKFVSTNNGAIDNYRIGDDLFLGDINLPNTACFAGVQDSSKAHLRLGSNGPTIGSSGSSFSGSPGSPFFISNLIGTSTRAVTVNSFGELGTTILYTDGPWLPLSGAARVSGWVAFDSAVYSTSIIGFSGYTLHQLSIEAHTAFSFTGAAVSFLSVVSFDSSVQSSNSFSFLPVSQTATLGDYGSNKASIPSTSTTVYLKEGTGTQHRNYSAPILPDGQIQIYYGMHYGAPINAPQLFAAPDHAIYNTLGEEIATSSSAVSVFGVIIVQARGGNLYVLNRGDLA